MMTSLFDIQKFYDHPYVMQNEWEDLVIFNYTHACQFDRAWDEITRAARGIIFNRKTGEIHARTFPKFFSLGELDETHVQNLPKKHFIVTVKHDGSLGVHFTYNGKDYIATRGSFTSEQAQWATPWFRKNADPTGMNFEYTYLFEIIYKENKIVVDYGDFEGLILLGCIHKKTGHEMAYSDVAQEAEKLGIRVTEQETGFESIEDLYTYCKALPHTQEGFVVTFSNGLKVKMKGDEYCKVHKLVSRMTPLAFWEAWDLETQMIPRDFLVQIPEEFREAAEALESWVDEAHMSIAANAQNQYDILRGDLGPDATQKDMAITAKERYPSNMSLIMDIMNRKTGKFWGKIHRRVRPTGNVLPEGIKGAERLQRIADEG